MAQLLTMLALGISLAEVNPWGSDTSRAQARKAHEKIAAGDYQSAFNIYQQGLQQAIQTNNYVGQIRFLNSLGGCQIVLFRHQQALEYLIKARQLAEKYPDQIEELGAILFNLASLYLVTSNQAAAEQTARDGSELLRSRPDTYYKARLNLILAVLAANRKDYREAGRHFSIAAEAATDDATLALAHHHQGAVQLAAGDPVAAERPLLEAFRSRLLRNDPELVYTYLALAELHLIQGNLTLAESLTAQASHLSRTVPAPEHLLHSLRGRIRFRQGRHAEAHREFLSAFASIRATRADVLPADFFRINTGASLSAIYDDALRNALRWKGVPQKAMFEILLAGEEWKAAASNRELATNRLGADYWEALAEFRQLERESFRIRQIREPRWLGSKRYSQLKVRLAELESFAGVRSFSSSFFENFASLNPLILLRGSLEADSAFIRFYIGSGVAVRWILTSEGLEWKELPEPAQLAVLARRFRDAVHKGGASSLDAGKQLFERLFANAGPAALSARHWVLAPDGELLATPFAAMTTGAGKYLVEERSLQLVTGAQALLGGVQGNPDWGGKLLAIGDPVYNRADPRWKTAAGADDAADRREPGWFTARVAKRRSIELPRLSSSAKELEAIARSWGGPAEVLVGEQASRGEAVRQIEAGPSVVHFATHFLQQESSPDRALLVLTLDAKGEPDFFSPADAVHVHVKDSLVVLSGCHSAAGIVYPGAGLVGMTRAWLLAGAQGVVASLWAAPDDTGPIFEAFYRELHKSRGPLSEQTAAGVEKGSAGPRGRTLRKAAMALRVAQLEMLRTQSWRAQPNYWAAYQLIGRTT